jgi:hypothetical protein
MLFLVVGLGLCLAPFVFLTLGIMGVLHLVNGRLQKPRRGRDGPT